MTDRASRTPARLLLFSLAFSGALLAGCSDDSNNNTGGGPAASSEYVGLLASDNGQTGPLNLTFASPVAAPPTPLEPGSGASFSSGAPVNVTGTLQLGGGPLIDITGSLSDDDVLTMTGGGYDLVGDLDNGIITGGFTNAGIVLITGSFVAASSSDGSPALAFCGTFAGQDFDEPPTENSGTFSLVIAGNSASGVAYDDEGGALPLVGTATASTITINQTDPNSGGTLSATGNYGNGVLSGTFSVTLQGVPISTGTFSAGTCGQ